MENNLSLYKNCRTGIYNKSIEKIKDCSHNQVPKLKVHLNIYIYLYCNSVKVKGLIHETTFVVRMSNGKFLEILWFQIKIVAKLRGCSVNNF